MKRIIRKSPIRLSINLLTFACALFSSSKAQAELIAYEGFEYSAGSILGPNDLLGNGTLENGWESAWVPTRHSTPSGFSPLQEDSLSYTDARGNTLDTSGNHVLVMGQAQAEGGQNTTVGRDMAGLEPTIGSVYYISFIGQRQGDPVDMTDPYWETLDPPGYPYGTNPYPRAAGVRFLPNAGRNDLSGLVGRFSNQDTGVWTLAGDALTGEFDIESDVPLTETSFNVVRIEYYDAGMGEDGEGNVIQLIGTKVSLWVNPVNLNFETAPVGTGIPDDEGQPVLWEIDGIGIEGNNESITPEGFVTRAVSKIAVDEIRIGTSWADVTPNDEVYTDPEDVVPGFYANLSNIEGDWYSTWAGPAAFLNDTWVWIKDMQEFWYIGVPDNADDGMYMYRADFSEWAWTSLIAYPWVYSYSLSDWLYLGADTD